MLPDKDNLHRIIAEMRCQFGGESEMYLREVYFSALGIVFKVMPEMQGNFKEGQRRLFTFELNQREMDLEAYVVAVKTYDLTTLAALQFIHNDNKSFDALNQMIINMGGFQKQDQQKKYAFLESHAPALLEKHRIKEMEKKKGIELKIIEKAHKTNSTHDIRFKTEPRVQSMAEYLASLNKKSR